MAVATMVASIAIMNEASMIAATTSGRRTAGAGGGGVRRMVGPPVTARRRRNNAPCGALTIISLISRIKFMASLPLHDHARSQFLTDPFQRRLAEWNRERLSPAFPADDWQTRIAGDAA